ncbi:phage portal protein [Methylobacterium oryzae]|uniref:phage portal protein n=1 Tax=Methylobacterium oryzae TaxID=334852 RepID=UPI001F1B27C3|nr:phage portal protein [Methylobacterium oryzae]UIN36289.1 phage portal protein [Methylobacterium oryzae]
MGTWTGKPVTAESTLQIATALACIRLTASTISTLPVNVYREGSGGAHERQPSHPLAVVLKQSPNADQTPVEFLEGMLSALMLWGNAFALKTESAGQIRALTFLSPERMTVRRDPETYELQYIYSEPRGRETYSAAEIWHLRAFGVGGDLGLSPIQYGRQALGLAMATDEAAARTFANGMKPGGFFLSKNQLTEPQRAQARKVLVEPMQGAENAGRIGILEGDAFTWQPITMPLKDAELLATRGLHIEEICRLFGIPPILVGHAANGVTAWGTGIETIVLSWLTTSLGPLLRRIEASMNKALIAPGERGTVWAEFSLEGLLRADSDARAKLYASAAQNGWMKRNEIRRLENLPPEPGGDVLTAQSNLVPLEKLGTIIAPTREVPPANNGEHQ